MSTNFVGKTSDAVNFNTKTLSINGQAVNPGNPGVIPDPLIVNELQANKIGVASNPVNEITMASDFNYQNDLKFFDTSDPNPINHRQQLNIETDGTLRVHTGIAINDFILNNPASREKFKIGLDTLDSTFQISSTQPVEQVRLSLSDTGINTMQFQQMTMNVGPLGSGILVNDGDVILNGGNLTVNAGGVISGDGSGLTNLPGGGGGTQDLQSVCALGSTTTANNVSFTGTGTMTIDHETISGNNIRLESGTGGDGKVSIGEQTQGFVNCDHIGNRSIAIGRNTLSFNAQDTNDAICIGSGAGNNNCSDFVVSIGDDAGQNDCGEASVCIGKFAGEFNHGTSSVSIGSGANQNSGVAVAVNNSICINATGVELNNTLNDTCIIAPIRAVAYDDTTMLPLYYDNTSKELVETTQNDLERVCNAGNSTQVTDISFIGGVQAPDEGSFQVYQRVFAGSTFRCNTFTATLNNSISIGKQALGVLDVTQILGAENICIGTSTAANGATAAENNICIGSEAGENGMSGRNNIFIGQKAGQNTSGLADGLTNNIVINATNTELNPGGLSNSCYIRPIRASPDVPSETLQLYYDSASNEVRSGTVSGGSVGSLAQVLAIGNSGTNIQLTGDLNCTAIRMTSSQDWAYVTPTSSLTINGIPLTGLSTSYKTNVSPNNFTGEVYTMVNTSASTILSGTVVQFDTSITATINGVIPYSATATKSNDNCAVLGIVTADSLTGNSCFVLISGFASVRCLDGVYVRGQLLGVGAGGIVSGAQITGQNTGIIGVCMQTVTLGSPDAVLCYIQARYQF
jgi:hypothetical protein